MPQKKITKEKQITTSAKVGNFSGYQRTPVKAKVKACPDKCRGQRYSGDNGSQNEHRRARKIWKK